MAITLASFVNDFCGLFFGLEKSVYLGLLRRLKGGVGG